MKSFNLNSKDISTFKKSASFIVSISKNQPSFESQINQSSVGWNVVWVLHVDVTRADSIQGKSDNTVVLPWFCKIEHGGGSGGTLQFFCGLTLPRRLRRSSWKCRNFQSLDSSWDNKINTSFLPLRHFLCIWIPCFVKKLSTKCGKSTFPMPNHKY